MEDKELRFAKEKLRIFFDAEFFAPSRLSSPCGDKLQ